MYASSVKRRSELSLRFFTKQLKSNLKLLSSSSYSLSKSASIARDFKSLATASSAEIMSKPASTSKA